MEKRRKEISETVRFLLQKGRSIHDVLASLRRDGIDKAMSIRALMDGADLTPKDAKRSVHESPAWADVWQRDEAIFGDEPPMSDP
jgi:hypothetical protein